MGTAVAFEIRSLCSANSDTTLPQLLDQLRLLLCTILDIVEDSYPTTSRLRDYSLLWSSISSRVTAMACNERESGRGRVSLSPVLSSHSDHFVSAQRIIASLEPCTFDDEIARLKTRLIVESVGKTSKLKIKDCFTGGPTQHRRRTLVGISSKIMQQVSPLSRRLFNSLDLIYPPYSPSILDFSNTDFYF